MPEDNLPRRSRASRQRFEQIHESFLKDLEKEESWWDAIEAKREEAKRKDDAGDLEAAEMLREEAFDLKTRHIDLEKTRAYIAEVKVAIEELESVRMEAFIEGSKLRSETLKQQATFSGAAIVGVAAITRGVLPHAGTPLSNVLLILIYFVLLSTICTSLLLMHWESLEVEQALTQGERPARERSITLNYYASALGLPVAIVLFVIYEVANALG